MGVTEDRTEFRMDSGTFHTHPSILAWKIPSVLGTGGQSTFTMATRFTCVPHSCHAFKTMS